MGRKLRGMGKRDRSVHVGEGAVAAAGPGVAGRPGRRGGSGAGGGVISMRGAGPSSGQHGEATQGTHQLPHGKGNTLHGVRLIAAALLKHTHKRISPGGNLRVGGGGGFHVGPGPAGWPARPLSSGGGGGGG